MAELAERAQIISREAGTRISAAMRDVISAGAGIAGFAIESARDLVQFMVRRGQMTQDEADRLIREAEEAHARRPASERARPTASTIAAEKAAVARAEAAARNAEAAEAYHRQLQAKKLGGTAAPPVASKPAKPIASSKPAVAKKPVASPVKAAPAPRVAQKPAAKAAKGTKAAAPAAKGGARAPAAKKSTPSRAGTPRPSARNGKR